jgi:hypothetical protein
MVFASSHLKTVSTLINRQAYLVIELQQGAQWDWGKVIFQNVTIEAETTNTTWCTVYVCFPRSVLTYADWG